MQNIALISDTDQVEAINFDPNNRFRGLLPDDCSDRKDKLLRCHDVTNGLDKMVDVRTVVSAAQMPRKLFLAHSKLLTDIDCFQADLLACDSQFQFDFEPFNLGVLQEAYDYFLKTLKSLNDEVIFKNFSKDVIERFQNCVKLFKVKKVHLGKRQNNANGYESNSVELIPSDSV